MTKNLSKKVALGVVATVLLLSQGVNANWVDSIKGSTSNNNVNGPLPSLEAFNPSGWIEDDHLYIGFAIDEGYYLYKDMTTLSVGGAEIDGGFSSNFAVEDDPHFGEVSIYEGEGLYRYKLSDITSLDDTNLTFRGCARDILCYQPEEVSLGSLGITQGPPESASATLHLMDKIEDVGAAVSGDATSKGLILSAILFFIAGLGLSLTPCVLPMLPVLGAIVTAGSRTKRGAAVLSSFYGLGVIVAYTLLGLGVGYLGAEFNLSERMQSPFVLIPTGFLFLFFGLITLNVINLSFFSISGKVIALQDKLQKMGFVGVFLAGFLSVLILSPCVSAPMGAAALYIGTAGSLFNSVVVMGSLSFGMVLPLVLVSVFGSQFLPKAGAWMDKVKEVVGIILIAMAIFTVKDLVPHTALMIMIAGITIFTTLTINAFNLKPRTPLVRFYQTGQILLLMIALSFVFKINGVSYSGDSQIEVSAPYITTTSVSKVKDEVLNREGIKLVYIGADWCTSCKKMEKSVFTEAKTASELSKITMVKLDATKGSDELSTFMKDSGVFGAPSFLLYDEAGQLVNTSIGEIDGENLITFIN